MDICTQNGGREAREGKGGRETSGRRGWREVVGRKMRRARGGGCLSASFPLFLSCTSDPS